MVHSTKSTVWYITHSSDFFYLDLSVKTMSAYDWVTDILIVYTDDEKPSQMGDLTEKYFPKVKFCMVQTYKILKKFINY